MDKLDKYKNNPLALQAWQDGYEEGLDQCHISMRVTGWSVVVAFSIFLIFFNIAHIDE